MKIPSIVRPFAYASVGLLFSATAAAHPGHDGDHGGGLIWDFIGGLRHPLGGLDHLVAMIAVGIWAAQLAGRARWAVPAAFMAALATGNALGPGVAGAGWIEQAIAASVLGLGLLVVTAARLPLAAGIGLAALFAIFHGSGHPAEMPVNARGISYILGFLVATAALHASGVGLGLLSARAPKWARRSVGASIVLAGAWILIA